MNWWPRTWLLILTFVAVSTTLIGVVAMTMKPPPSPLAPPPRTLTIEFPAP